MAKSKTHGGHTPRIAIGILAFIILTAAYTGVVGAQHTPFTVQVRETATILQFSAPSPASTTNAVSQQTNSSALQINETNRLSDATVTNPQTIVVPATVQWADTGVTLSAGDHLIITATGSWSPGPDMGTWGPDGSTQLWSDNFLNLADIGVCSVCASTPTSHFAGLIGYIGDNPPAAGSYTSTSILSEAQKVFFVGSNFDNTTPEAGRLWLNFNDDAYSGYTVDNSGQVTATITTNSTTEQPQLKAPWEGVKTITQGNNGTTSHYDHGTWDNTYAIDVNLTSKSNVLAPADGTVEYVDHSAAGSGGKELAINHSGPTGKYFITVYLHLSKILVKKGDFVKQGQVVAESGNTGTGTTGAHLHFHIYRPPGDYDAHTMPIERLVMKQVGVDPDFKEYNASRGELDDNKTEGKSFESNNIPINNTNKSK